MGIYCHFYLKAQRASFVEIQWPPCDTLLARNVLYAIRANHLRDGYIIGYVKLETTIAQSELVLVCHSVFQLDDLPRFGFDIILGGIH